MYPVMAIIAINPAQRLSACAVQRSRDDFESKSISARPIAMKAVAVVGAGRPGEDVPFDPSGSANISWSIL